jgi:hypothetical protein
MELIEFEQPIFVYEENLEVEEDLEVIDLLHVLKLVGVEWQEFLDGVGFVVLFDDVVMS